MVRALNLSLNQRVGLTYHLPVSFTANDMVNAPSRLPTTHHRCSSSLMVATFPLSDTTLAPLPHELHDQETVSTPPASSFPSIMSFQTLTNWWSPGSTAAKSSSTASNKLSNDVRKPKGPLEKKFISKEKQLEKLRIRLDQERIANCRGHLQVDICKACRTGEVSL